jgi:(2Fe-2S) ferredoxin
MADDSRAQAAPVQLYLCTQQDCARRVVALKIYTHDCETIQLTGPSLLQTLQTLVIQKGIEQSVYVRETSCMRGCRVGPRLNVVEHGRFQDAVRYLHLPANRHHWRCVAWTDVDSVESLLDHYVYAPQSGQTPKRLVPTNAA